ncbi:cytochrome c oxidase subunit III [Bradyrhizobium sp. SSBR45G]|nr:cytochrome c oxidase subunit III [Bradyrhizobium sp. SSBR45G]GLH87830.1 cytochrome c oxidase subunit III [Bradyrhizobium sp. SSBR45R]
MQFGGTTMGHAMNRAARLVISIAATAGAVFLRSSAAPGEFALSPIFGVGIPPDYRHWELVGVAHETGLDELRGIVGNATAIEAYRAGTLPFPDGSILVKLAWKHVQSTEFEPAFVPGPATTVQVMVKDSKRYRSTGGWGFGRFIDGRPVDEAQHQTCFGCHAAGVKQHDFVFTRLAP